MKKIAFFAATVGSFIALASAANAADVSTVVGYDWSGFYVGANGGVAWNNSSIENNFLTPSGDPIQDFENKFDSEQSAFTAGGLIGYNYQIDQIVLGAEADFNYLGFSDSNTRSGLYNDSDVFAKTSFEADWFGTIRARLGYAIDNVLIYGTGGAAYGHMNASYKMTITTDDVPVTWDGSADSTNWGWTVGGGAEYGIDNWSLGLEYLYVDLGSAEWDGKKIEEQRITGDADYAFSTVRATVKYRFQ